MPIEVPSKPAQPTSILNNRLQPISPTLPLYILPSLPLPPPPSPPVPPPSTATMLVPHFLSILLVTFIISSSSSSTTISSNKTHTFNIKPESFFNPKFPPRTLSSNKKFDGSSNLVDLRYHMGPVLSSSPINIYLIWYDRWSTPQQLLIKDFILSISSPTEPSPSVAKWWRIVVSSSQTFLWLLGFGQYASSSINYLIFG
ncbi:protein EXORDIUM-like 5 [Tripterygium wilfordii]|uniref:Protein EXORDIUM-like 5 n=1 Tax=Tripterygium wilfordii TaxID=458696 RepID=A0A7J7DG72_TRIWF|nr:protein EXORDIUM-like 5 [Tripterygium wilfordii]